MRIKRIKKQLGQAFPVGIALFFVLGVGSFVLFNTGQTVSEKTRVVNTADSAAYSGLLWQARAMNFTAYTNRAMVANQVAMAQAVSIHSWAAYIKLTGSNLDAVLGKIPFVGVVTGIVKAVSSMLELFLSPISEAMLQVINGINSGITIAQEGMYLSTFAATPDVVNTVVKSNDIRNQDFKWETAFSMMNTGLNLNGWSNLTKQYDKGDINEIFERAHMVDMSLDKFSKERKWEFFGFFIPVTPINWVRIEKVGTTKSLGLTPGDDWELHANDAISLRMKRYTWRGKKYSDIPIAGASSVANTDDSWDTIMPNEVEFHGNRHKIAKKRVRAQSSFIATHDGRQMDGYDGMHAYRSLTTEWRRGTEPPKLKLRIEVTLDPKNIHSAADMRAHERFTTDIDTPGDVITSVSAAELFFERPCLNDSCGNTEEYADSYSPYWDVKLAENSNSARLAAYALHGDTLTDDTHFTRSNITDLADFDSSPATPVDDYEAQAEGVDSTLASMEARLASLEENSPEFNAYKTRLDNIKSNINLEVGDIVDNFVFDDISEDDLIQQLAKAADFDFNVTEFEAFKGAISGAYQGMENIVDIAALEDQFADMLDDAAGTVEDKIRDALEEELRSAVRRIMAGLIAGAVQDFTGIELTDAEIESMTAATTDQILDTRINPTDETDIEIVDLRNECEVYGLVHDAEVQVEDMQRRLEAVNQAIADDFHVRLVEVTADISEQKGIYDARIIELQGLLRTPDPYRTHNGIRYDEIDDYRQAVTTSITAVSTARSELYGERVDTLTADLQRISDEHTATIPEFDDYRLEERFARQAVEDTLGDIYDLTIDENGETVSDNMFFAEAENELDSDREQNFTPPPENC